MNRPILSFAAALAISLPCSAIRADTIYQSIDASGNVTFSDTPSEGAAITRSVPVPQGPSEEAVEKAREEVEAISERADALEQKRLRKEQARRAEEHEQQRSAATAAPAEAVEYATPGYWYPAYPRHPLRPHRPYPPYYQGGDHPAYSPGIPGPHPPVRPVTPPVNGQVLGPAR